MADGGGLEDLVRRVVGLDAGPEPDFLAGFGMMPLSAEKSALERLREQAKCAVGLESDEDGSAGELLDFPLARLLRQRRILPVSLPSAEDDEEAVTLAVVHVAAASADEVRRVRQLLGAALLREHRAFPARIVEAVATNPSLDGDAVRMPWVSALVWSPAAGRIAWVDRSSNVLVRAALATRGLSTERPPPARSVLPLSKIPGLRGVRGCAAVHGAAGAFVLWSGTTVWILDGDAQTARPLCDLETLHLAHDDEITATAPSETGGLWLASRAGLLRHAQFDGDAGLVVHDIFLAHDAAEAAAEGTAEGSTAPAALRPLGLAQVPSAALSHLGLEPELTAELLVSDASSRTVRRLRATGPFAFRDTGAIWSAAEAFPDQPALPVGLTVDARGRVWIAVAGAHCLAVRSLDPAASSSASSSSSSSSTSSSSPHGECVWLPALAPSCVALAGPTLSDVVVGTAEEKCARALDPTLERHPAFQAVEEAAGAVFQVVPEGPAEAVHRGSSSVGTVKVKVPEAMARRP